MLVEPSLPANGQALEVVQKREGLLDDVAELPRSLMLGASLREIAGRVCRLRSLQRLGVALVAEHGVGPAMWTAGLAGHGRYAVDQGQGLRDLVDVGGGSDDLERVPRSSQIRWCLPPVFQGSTCEGPVPSPAFWAGVGAVHARAGPVEFVGRLQPGEQDVVQPVKDSGLLPSVQAAPAGLSGAYHRLRW
ncbi:hypothetical protein ACWEN3_36545 [Streptomyces sp. NPDC004561]